MRYSPILPWMLVLPTIIVLTVFVLYPAVSSFFLSFFAVAPFSGEKFYVGLDNYLELAFSSDYRQSFLTSLLFVLLTVPSSFVVSLAIALALDGQPYFRGFLRTIFLMPVGISAAMAGMIWIFLFNPSVGYLNYLLSLIGVDGPQWLTDPKWAIVAVALTSVWKEVGFNVIFFLAGLAGVPHELREASLVDGANWVQRLRYVVFPLLSPTIFFVLVVSVIHSFESFGQIHILTRGGPADSTNVLVYNLFRDAFQYFRAGLASAQAVILFIVIMICTWLQFSVSRGRIHYR